MWLRIYTTSDRRATRATPTGQNRRVQFSPDLRERVADGTITVSYRLWSRPKVKVGGVYRSASVWIEVDEIDLVPFSSVTAEDLALDRRSGPREPPPARRPRRPGPRRHPRAPHRVPRRRPAGRPGRLNVLHAERPGGDLRRNQRDGCRSRKRDNAARNASRPARSLWMTCPAPSITSTSTSATSRRSARRLRAGDGVGLGRIGGDQQRRHAEAHGGIEEVAGCAGQHGVQHRGVDLEHRRRHRRHAIGEEDVTERPAARGVRRRRDHLDECVEGHLGLLHLWDRLAQEPEAVEQRVALERTGSAAVIAPSGGSSSTTPASRSGRRWAIAAAVAPPREWPTTTHGRPAACSSAATASATYPSAVYRPAARSDRP